MAVSVASVCAGFWAAERSPWSAIEGLPVGNKQLVAYRRGVDFRVSTVEGLLVLASPSVIPTANTRAAAAANEGWGGPYHWLKVPAWDLSLWWPFGLSLVLPGIWLLRRRRREAVGFPVGVIPGAR